MDSFEKIALLKGRKKLVFYGMGKLAEEALQVLKSYEINVDFFVDRKFDVINEFMGKRVTSSQELDVNKHFVVIIPLQFYNQIKSVLVDKGFHETKDFCKWDDLCQEDFVFDGVEIGRRSHGFFAFQDCLGLSTKNYIKSIGRFVSINKAATVGADHVVGLTTSHEVYRLSNMEAEILHAHKKTNQVSIGNDVWIGANTFINASKVRHIGDGAIIGTGAVVITDVPSYAVMCGVPAKPVKFRFSEKEIEILERVKWWNWSDEEICENKEMFQDVSLFFKKYC